MKDTISDYIHPNIVKTGNYVMRLRGLYDNFFFLVESASSDKKWQYIYKDVLKHTSKQWDVDGGPISKEAEDALANTMIVGPEQHATDVTDAIFVADPISMKTKYKKSPFVNVILKWYINGKIRLPEDISTVADILKKYQDAKNNQGFNGDINDFSSPGELRKVLQQETGRDGYDIAELEATHGDYKLYRIRDWDQGRICFADSGWCVQHEGTFEGYGPPFFMVTKNKKRVALMHQKSMQIKDVQDDPISPEAADAILPLIGKVFTRVGIASLVYEYDMMYPNPEAESILKSKTEFIEKFDKDPIGTIKELSTPSDKITSNAAFLVKKSVAKLIVMTGRATGKPNKEAANLLIKDNIVEAVHYWKSLGGGGRWPELEDAILHGSESEYGQDGAWGSGHRPKAAMTYGELILNRHWEEAEPIMLKADPQMALHYMKYFLRRQWPALREHFGDMSGGWVEAYDETAKGLPTTK